ncbi:terminase small subunit [Changpingibacter yushuensis]|uniref:terminase small subunit n=1 Tax=Changpingibacter yushuensis TaxID=2758440 RepID=UPI00165DB302|nr:hypothetical protein [Changpingibacter yushuensis]
MATKFEDHSLEDALNRSLRNASHLRAKDAATVAAARALARKIDAWNVIVEWALEDMEELDLRRPAVPQNDNVSLASFLKYMDALGLVPEVEAVKPAARAGKTAKTAAKPKSELDAWRSAKHA